MPDHDLQVDRARLDRIRHGATVGVTQPTVVRVTGNGALACLQGLLTNDLEKPGNDSLVYGALLTPKGMIVVDAWVLRQGDTVTLIMPRSGHAAAIEIFTRTLPPRLARATDLTGQAAVAWLIGGHGFQVLAKSGVPLPDAAGRVRTTGGDLSPVAVALAPEDAPFVAVAVGLGPALEQLVGRLEGAGAVRGEEDDLHVCRILAGWPLLGAEIDERTLPQEVRYDSIGGVSYTKGCYTGQETVARVHFRGHTNRELRGLRWNDPAPLEDRTVRRGEKELGTVRSTLALDDRLLGLAMLRREVEVGDTLAAGGREARVTALPFEADEVDG